jgi:hypothetical protein
MLGSSRLDQMVDRKSSDTSGARLLRCRRNRDGLRSPISIISSWQIHCPLEGVSHLTSSALSVV